jgi:hypothetical protein
MFRAQPICAATIKGLLVHHRTTCLPPERGVFHLQEVGQPVPRQVVERRLRIGQPLYDGRQSVAEVTGALTDDALDLQSIQRVSGSESSFEQGTGEGVRPLIDRGVARCDCAGQACHADVG